MTSFRLAVSSLFSSMKRKKVSIVILATREYKKGIDKANRWATCLKKSLND